MFTTETQIYHVFYRLVTNTQVNIRLEFKIKPSVVIAHHEVHRVETFSLSEILKAPTHAILR